jgi:hypothetical protein
MEGMKIEEQDIYLRTEKVRDVVNDTAFSIETEQQN